MSKFVGALVLVALGMFMESCSISWSISESSDSSASSSESSSPKDGIGKAKIAYRDDVANMTMSVAGSNFSSADFMSAVGRIATQHGISDWEGEKASYYGIGKGLRKAGIPKENVPTIRFLSGVLGARKEALDWIQTGYRY